MIGVSLTLNMTSLGELGTFDLTFSLLAAVTIRFSTPLMLSLSSEYYVSEKCHGLCTMVNTKLWSPTSKSLVGAELNVKFRLMNIVDIIRLHLNFATICY